MSLHIARRIIVDQGLATERRLIQADIASLPTPLILLGEPGLGKSTLCEDLSIDAEHVLVSATRFLLVPDAVATLGAKTLVIDGLDEVTSNTPGSAVDAVVTTLSELGWPKFILSCRAIDWRGAVDSYKLKQAYGRQPTVLHLEPLRLDEATQLLAEWQPTVDAKAVLERLDDKGLAEIYGNPLSLRLLGEAARNGAIPDTRAGILRDASVALLREGNDAHKGSPAATASPDQLLEGAGAVCAVLLLTGKLGVYLGAYADTPPLYCAKADLSALTAATAISDALTTRLFRGDGENRIAPIHRVIAEYLGARWLASRIKPDQSPRRILQLLQFQGGVPSPLRGLHAWLPHFQPRIAEAVITADPFGLVRYGDSDEMPIEQARLLLQALSSLVEDDPYFRSEDWSDRRVPALANPALRSDILTNLRKPERRFHLSTFLLRAIAGSALAKALQADLQQIVLDASAAYGERAAAAESLMDDAAVDWPKIVRKLLDQGAADAARLAVEIITQRKAEGFSADDVVQAAFHQAGLTVSELPRRDEDDHGHVVGVAYLLAEAVPLAQLVAVLDVAKTYASTLYGDAHWEVKWTVREFVETAIFRILQSDTPLRGDRLWQWIRYLQGSESPGRADKIREVLANRLALRRETQVAALADPAAAENLWMRAHALSDTGFGLYPNEDDAIEFLRAFAAKPAFSEGDKEDWKDLLLVARTQKGLSAAVIAVAQATADRDPALATALTDATTVRIPEWQVRQEDKQRERAAARDQQTSADRADYMAHIDELRAGNVRRLYKPAQAYLGRLGSSRQDVLPMDRLASWLGSELAEVVTQGCVTALSNTDLPTAEAVAKLHLENREYYAEYVITCGIAELLRSGTGLAGVSRPVLLAAWVSWEHLGNFNTRSVHTDVGKALEAVLFTDPAARSQALQLQIEPQVTAGHEHVGGLYQAAHDAERRKAFAPTAYDWLKSGRALHVAVESQLIDIVLKETAALEAIALVRHRLNDPSLSAAQRSLWLAAAFAIDFSTWRDELSKAAAADKDFLWTVRARAGDDSWGPQGLAADQLHFIIAAFGLQWPPIEAPSSGSGDANPWDATRYINNAITKLGTDASEAAATALDQLSTMPGLGYRDLVLHIKAQQQKTRRDSIYVPATPTEVAAVLRGGLPTRLEDLKAYVMDHLDSLQVYLRGSDVNTREMFYDAGEPLAENPCRNRLIDLLRPRVNDAILLMPETQMPQNKRVAI